jgi:ribosomal protein L37AE/L43A
MPCYRCGVRQVDPDRGESPWKRGVRADRQVLICPACQASVNWSADLDRCPACESVHLVRRLGEVECQDCGHVREPGDDADLVLAGSGDLSAMAASGAPAGDAALDLGDTQPGLAREVELALDRVLGRAGRPARIG